MQKRKKKSSENEPMFDFEVMIGSPCPTKPKPECLGCAQYGEGAIYACHTPTRVMGVWCNLAKKFRIVDSGRVDPGNSIMESIIITGIKL